MTYFMKLAAPNGLRRCRTARIRLGEYTTRLERYRYPSVRHGTCLRHSNTKTATMMASTGYSTDELTDVPRPFDEASPRIVATNANESLAEVRLRHNSMPVILTQRRASRKYYINHSAPSAPPSSTALTSSSMSSHRRRSALDTPLDMNSDSVADASHSLRQLKRAAKEETHTDEEDNEHDDPAHTPLPALLLNLSDGSPLVQQVLRDRSNADSSRVLEHTEDSLKLTQRRRSTIRQTSVYVEPSRASVILSGRRSTMFQRHMSIFSPSKTSNSRACCLM